MGVRIMLGDQLGEEIGQITGTRVLPGANGPVVEVSFQSNGTLCGVRETNMGTYITMTRPDGTLSGEGQGVVMTDDGETAAWKGHGVGRFTGTARRCPGAARSTTRPPRPGWPASLAPPGSSTRPTRAARSRRRSTSGSSCATA